MPDDDDSLCQGCSQAVWLFLSEVVHFFPSLLRYDSYTIHLMLIPIPIPIPTHTTPVSRSAQHQSNSQTKRIIYSSINNNGKFIELGLIMEMSIVPMHEYWQQTTQNIEWQNHRKKSAFYSIFLENNLRREKKTHYKQNKQLITAAFTVCWFRAFACCLV